YPVHQRYWELPQGAWEQRPEADHAAIAAGELREETGLVAKNMLYVGYQYLAYGYSTQGYHIYLATGLEQHGTNLDAEEEGLIAKKFLLREFENMILAGAIKDTTTTNAYGLAKLAGLL